MGTFFVAALLIAVVICIIRHLIKQWKDGSGFCGCNDCKHCGHCEGIRQTEAAVNESSGTCSGNCAACKGCMHQK